MATTTTTLTTKLTVAYEDYTTRTYSFTQNPSTLIKINVLVRNFNQQVSTNPAIPYTFKSEELSPIARISEARVINKDVRIIYGHGA